MEMFAWTTQQDNIVELCYVFSQIIGVTDLSLGVGQVLRGKGDVWSTWKVSVLDRT